MNNNRVLTSRTVLLGRLSLLLVPWLTVLGIVGLTPILSQISSHFSSIGGADTFARSLVTSVGAAIVVGAPVAGILAGRLGERKVLLFSLGLFAVAGTIGAWLEEPWMLLVSRVVLGFALAATGVTAITLLINSVPAEARNRWLGFFTLAGTTGGLVVLPAAGYIGSLEWRGVFLLHLIALPILLLVLALLPDTPRARADGGATAPVFSLSLLLLSLACGAVLNTVPVYIPFLLADIGLTGSRDVATALMVSTAAAALIALGYGWFRRHLGSALIFALAFLATSAGLGLIAGGRTFDTTMLGMLLVGSGVGMLAPNLFAVAAAAPAERRATRIGISRAGIFGAPLLAQFALEPIAESHGPGGALFAIGGFAFLMIAVSIAGRRTFTWAA